MASMMFFSSSHPYLILDFLCVFSFFKPFPSSLVCLFFKREAKLKLGTIEERQLEIIKVKNADCLNIVAI